MSEPFDRAPDRQLPNGYWASWDNPKNQRHISASFSANNKDDKDACIVFLFLWTSGLTTPDTQQMEHPVSKDDIAYAWEWLNSEVEA